MMGRYDDEPYEIGKGKPPIGSRWKKGESGNPRGRPKKGSQRSESLCEIAARHLNETMAVTLNGKTKKLAKKEVIIMGFVNDAITGTPAQKLQAYKRLEDLGACAVSAADRAPSAEARRKFLEGLAEEARKEEGWKDPRSRPSP